MPRKKINFTIGEINIDDSAWDELVRVNHIFFSVNATFSSLSVSFLGMFVTTFSFLYFHVFCFVFMFMPS